MNSDARKIEYINLASSVQQIKLVSFFFFAVLYNLEHNMSNPSSGKL